MKKLITVFFLFLISCGDAPLSEDEKAILEEENRNLFNIVYQACGVRNNNSNNTSFTSVTGVHLIQFLAQSSESSAGTFTYSYTDYGESLFGFQGCSGGYVGTFADATAEETNSSDLCDENYNVLDCPYDPPFQTEDPVTDTEEEETATIYSFLMDLTIVDQDLSETCPQAIGRRIRVLRFQDGSAIVTDDFKDYYFRPQLSNGSNVCN
tara:strand:+ start:5895 stop:6521 length:627 start_codon:yes stop_codon:yes gene_type:complete